MLRIVLITSPISLEDRYGRFSGAGSTEPSFALACLAAVALQEGMDVRIVDAAAENLSVRQTVEQLEDFRPDVAGISSTTAGIAASGALARSLKKFDQGIITIIGGCHVTALPEETLAEYRHFDVAVLGEGEETFSEILKAASANGNIPENLPGTARRINGRIVVNERHPLIDNLDRLPLPAWRLLQGFPEAFHPSPARMNRYPCASVVLSRGCPNRCAFCDRSVFGHRVRSYSPAYALNMFKDLARQFGVREILIEDDTFIILHSWIREFCERLIAENIDVTWSCVGRADRVTLDILKLMKQAGCWHISYGIESGDQRILDAMNKNEDIAQIESAVRWSRDAGLKTKGFFMVGFPGETPESLKLTKDLALKLPLNDITVMQLTPFPGTALYQHADEYGVLERDWSKMNTLNTVFTPSGFTQRDMDEARSDMLKAFYFRPSIVAGKLMQAASNPRLLRHMFKGFMALLSAVRSR
ncbi:MAG: cobalamin-dependent protein [Deltaproteobacteria bacterium]|nr:cobalamin-dependent protein [Deltaproteobacteria bacterium]